MPDNAALLLKMAEAEFPDLTDPEREVVRCAAVGEIADLSYPGPPHPYRFRAGGKPLRSAVVELLCTDTRAQKCVHRNGILIVYASLDQYINIVRANIPFFFSLQGCRLPGLSAGGVQFGDCLSLRYCHVDGIIEIISSRICGQIQFHGTLVCGVDGVSINADGADIGNHVFLSDGFRAVGKVHLLGAKIKGQLYCKDGHFLNRKGVALSAENADIGNHIFLSDGFRAVGKVDLLGAKIKGQLYCKGGQFLNRNGIALSAENTDIGNHVFLSDGFRSVGSVHLLGAVIQGQLNCTKGCFLNSNENALSVDNAYISSNILLSNGFHAEGQVCLSGAKVKGQLYCDGGTFLNKDGITLNLQGTSVGDALLLEPKRLCGVVDFHNAEAMVLRMRSPSTAGAILDLRGAKVDTLLDSRDSWPEVGRLKLDGFVYGDILETSPRSAAERLDWLKRMPNGQFLPQPYEQLAAWFQRTGHDSEARAVRMAKEEQRRAHFTRKRDKLWWWVKKWTIGYGYKPHYALGWLGLLILVGWLVFALGHKGMTQSVSYNLKAFDLSNATASLVASDYPTFRPFVYSVDVALPIVDLQQERYWMPNSHHKGAEIPWFESGWWLWGINWAEVLLGWFFASMGIAGATGIIRKD